MALWPIWQLPEPVNPYKYFSVITVRVSTQV